MNHSFLTTIVCLVTVTGSLGCDRYQAQVRAAEEARLVAEEQAEKARQMVEQSDAEAAKTREVARKAVMDLAGELDTLATTNRKLDQRLTELNEELEQAKAEIERLKTELKNCQSASPEAADQ